MRDMQKKQTGLIILLTVLLIASLSLLGTQVVKKFIRTSGEVSLKSNSIGTVTKTWEFSPENALPGDSESKEYVLRLSLQDDAKLFFRPEVVSEENGLSAALLLKAENTASGNVICEGRLSELVGHEFAEDFSKQDKSVTYKITVTIDPAAGNEYQNAKAELRFHWSFVSENTKEGDGQ